MKQVIQSVRTGEARVVDVPAPGAGRGKALVQVAASLVSAGTERMIVDFAEKNLLQKARSRPDLVRQTVDKARREGVLTTLEAVQNRLDQPMALGYSCAGTVIEQGKPELAAGQEPAEVQSGDRVACAGGGYAVHAEAVSVPGNLLVKVPDNVDFESAAFTTVGAIALQGIRLAEVNLGEVAAVIGLGLIGQLTVQMLKAAGCIVVGMDIQPQRAELAKRLGADAVASTSEELTTVCMQLSSGHGADAVLITADTKSNQPVEVAGEIARDKGTIVAVGAVGLNIPRKVYYEKELDFRISRSYGPGRYDPAYEEKGQDYPYGYVRWTERRNMQAFVTLLAQGKVDVRPLITHRFGIEEASRAYDLITGKIGEPFLGVILTYPEHPVLSRKVKLEASEHSAFLTNFAGTRHSAFEGAPVGPLDKIRLGVLGAGNYASSTLLPAIKDLPLIELVGIASHGGLTARSSGEKYGFRYCASEIDEILTDSEVNTIAVLTRHNLHAQQVVAALKAGKHTFVEKPLCLTEEELQSIVSTYESLAPATQESTEARSGGRRTEMNGDERQPASPPLLMVGFNRRFAPFVIELKKSLKGIREPLMMHYRVNAGYIPPQHWVHDPQEGGGRLLGEGCHFIDLLIHLAGEQPVRVTTRALPNGGRYSHDNLLVVLEFGGGSIGTITYLANGDKGFGKEMLEVSGGGLSARLDDYRTLHIAHGGKQIRKSARLRQDKGHRAEWQALTAYLTGAGARPIPFDELVLSARVTLAAQRSLESGEPTIIALNTEHEPSERQVPTAGLQVPSGRQLSRTEDEEPAL